MNRFDSRLDTVQERINRRYNIHTYSEYNQREQGNGKYEVKVKREDVRGVNIRLTRALDKEDGRNIEDVMDKNISELREDTYP